MKSFRSTKSVGNATLTFMNNVPPRPISFIASKSAVMPGLVMLPLM